MDGEGSVSPMVTCNMFEHPVITYGALTSNDVRIRAYACHPTMRAIDMRAEFRAFELLPGVRGA